MQLETAVPPVLGKEMRCGVLASFLGGLWSSGVLSRGAAFFVGDPSMLFGVVPLGSRATAFVKEEVVSR